ncbi:MAG: hypothetical protein IPM96_15960 [Ignavibacteria bacterium]|nr:hypothetical protein [Ignavibacteria bacterium]
MITEIRDDLVNFLRGLPEIAKANIYRGELESDGEWHPVMPAAFVNFTVINPKVYLSNSKTGRYKYSAEVYIADRNDCAPVTEEVAVNLNDASITVDDDIWQIKIIEISLIGYLRSVEVWRVKIELI